MDLANEDVIEDNDDPKDLDYVNIEEEKGVKRMDMDDFTSVIEQGIRYNLSSRILAKIVNSTLMAVNRYVQWCYEQSKQTFFYVIK